MKPEEAAEEVLVVPTVVVMDCNHGKLFDGVRTDVDTFKTVFDNNSCAFKLRGEVEQDPNWKQLIPYILIRYPRGAQTDGDWYLSYSRSSDQAEQRLAGKSSIGIGGHVTEADAEKPEAGNNVDMQFLLNHAYYGNRLWHGMVRELFEEIDIRAVQKARIVGVLNDESTDVGKVHLGVVVLVDVAATAVSSSDPYVQNLQWMSIRSLLGQIQYYEAWSKYCIDAINDGRFNNKA